MMKPLKIFCLIVSILILGAFLVFELFLIRVEVGKVGVRTRQYAVFGEKGVEQKDFGPGWHRKLPVFDTWKIFDTTVQTIQFTTSEEREHQRQIYSGLKLLSRIPGVSENPAPMEGPEMIEVKAKDANAVRLDVTVKYRIVEGAAHKIFQKFNDEVRYKNIVRDQVQNVVRGKMGEMDTEEFYDPLVRMEKTAVMTEILQKDLAERDIELVDILVRDISFDPAYEAKILQKKLADQDVELNKSKAQQEEKKGETNIILANTQALVSVIEEQMTAALVSMKAETDKKIAKINAEAQFQATQIRSEADLYAAEKIAKGNLMEREAMAQAEQLKAQALSGPGGANYVALQTIQALQLGDMKVSTIQNDFLDTEKMVEKMGATE
jgi:regulator of protease activity HflC (stomatin/prohibitin superfamily)